MKKKVALENMVKKNCIGYKYVNVPANSISI
jgi:hypothetical protein